MSSAPVADLILLLTPGFPAALAVLWALRPLRRRLIPLAPWAAVPALLLALLPGVDGASWSTFGIMTGLRLELDEVGRTFLLAVSLLWVVVGAFAGRYHRDDPHRERFFGFFVLTMAGNLGLVVAADAASFYLFFALMTFAAYGLIVHQRGDEAFRAGRVYIVLAMLGEAAVLASLFLIGAAAGGVPGFGPEMADTWASLARSGRAEWVAALVVAGFGVKAGLVPLHLWLPLAHPVAPTAASALLSGAMIKSGLLAWIRFIPPDVGLPDVGTVLVVIGAFSALYGVVVGLFQDDPKTILAYSSVSQMGFMAIGAGLVILTPDPTSIAILAVVTYALHHAVAKGALFLAVGVADRVPLHVDPAPRRSAGTPGIGGWAVFVLAGAALPALALSGAPGSTGALSKKVLKDAVYEVGPGLNAYLTPVLFLAGVGTTVLMARFLVRLALRMDRRMDREGGRGAPADDATQSRQATAQLVTPWAVLLVVGLTGPWWFAFGSSDAWGVTLPSAWTAWGTAAVPVLAGIALAWVIGRRPHILRGLHRVRIPAGDLLAPLERVIYRIGPLPIERWVEHTGRWVVHFRRSQRVAHGIAAWLADRDLMFARGRVVASIVLLLVLGLAALLV